MTIELVARTSALLLCAAALAGLLRRAAPATRHLIWSLAIMCVLLAPLLIAIVPRVPIVPILPAVPTVSFDTVPMILASGAPANLGTTAARNPWNPWNPGTLGTLGTLLIGSWFLLCWLLSGISVWRGSRPAPEAWLNETRGIARRIGMKGFVAVRELGTDASPHVAGFFQSVVMLPPSAREWTLEARQAAIVHELTHIKRHDRLPQAMAQLACAIYWFNPLIWYAASALARERERACDDAVLRFGAKASAYASLLLDLARAPQACWTPATALSMARPSAIEGRLLSILADASRTPRRSTRWLVGFAVLFLTTAILGAHAATPVAIADAAARRAPTRSWMLLDQQDTTQSVTGALVEALRNADGQVREQAAMGLALTPGTDVIEPLLGALQDRDAQVREKAAIGLAFRRDPKIVEPLLNALQDSDGQVREKAAIALGASGDARAVPALTRAMQDPDAQVREKAVAGLVLLGLRK